MTFEEASTTLLGRQSFIKNDNFDRVLACLEKLGSPHKRVKAVHVTGTNGKGAVCALFEAALRAAGYKTGLFVSPHLISLTERIRVSGEPISEMEFAALFSEVYDAGPELVFFELLTCMAFLYFERKGTDLAVIEVGIGGKFDTTNVLPVSELSVITSVDYDHSRYLGHTLEGIAEQKAGIIKKGGICLAPRLQEQATAQILKTAAAKGAEVKFIEPIFDIEAYDWAHGGIQLRHRTSGRKINLGMIGEKQISNASLAYEGLSILRDKGYRISESAVADGFAGVSWPGRFQVIRSGEAEYILDGAHNPEAARAFAETFARSPYINSAPLFIIGMLNDKDHAVILQTLAPFISKVIFTRPPSGRSLDPYALADEFSRLKPTAEIEVQDELDAALLLAGVSGSGVVLGSFYLVGAALKSICARNIQIRKEHAI